MKTASFTKPELKISAITNIKPNAWERDYGTDHLKLRILGPLQNQRLQLALGQSRPPGRHPNEGEGQLQHMKVLRQADKTIRHIANGCKWAKDVRNIVLTEW